jgi:hypothetical protein
VCPIHSYPKKPPNLRETIEELEVETFEWPRRLHLVRENRGMHYERALKR